MASEKLQVILELVSGQYKKEAGEAARATAGIGNAAKSSAGGVGGLRSGLNLLQGAVAAVGASKLIGELQDMAVAAAEDERAQERLAGALRTNTGATDDAIAANERWISTMQIATTTADNDLRQAITDLTVAGRSLEDAQNDVAIAIDIAASKGIDLTTVIKGMSRALATGSTGGFGRLGIETKNAAGEMLTYDEVLKNAAETMGGAAATAANTFAGAIERSRIAMEEAKEAAGQNFVGPMTVLTGVWNEFQTAILGGDEQLAELITTFNLLLSQGINPMEDAIASAITVLKTMNEVDLSAGTLDTLIAMLGLTEEQVLELRSAVLLSENAFGMEEDAAARLIGLLDGLVGNLDPAVLATQRHQAAMEKAAGAARDYTGALQAQRDLLKEMTDPVFALVAAGERYEDAQTRLNELTVDGRRGTDEYQDALGDVLRAQADLNQAQADANVVGSEGLDLLHQLAVQAGVNMTAFDLWRNSVDLLAGSITNLPATVGGRPTINSGPNVRGAFAEGGIVPGPRGSAQLILAHGGETVLPTHKGGFAGNQTTIVVQSPMNNFRSDLQYATIMASVTNLVEGF